MTMIRLAASKRAVIGALLTLSAASPAFADAETDALRAQIKALEARLDQMEKKQKTAAAAKSAPLPVAKQSDLENRVKIVERKQELAQEDAKAKAEKTANVEYGTKGLVVTSPDKKYSITTRAFVQADTRTFQDYSNTRPVSSSPNVDNFLIRTARVVVDAKLGDYFSAYFVPDFVSSSSRIADASVDFKPFPESKIFNLRVGKQKLPVGLERWQSEQNIPLVERSLANSLVPARDVGIVAYGDIVPEQLDYHLGVTNGAVDLGDNNTAAGDNKDFIGRVFTRPFRFSSVPLLDGFGLGLAGTYGNHNGSASNQNLTGGYVSPGQARYFAYRSTAFADGTKWRLNPQANYYNGPLSLQGEYILSSEKVALGTSHDTLKNSGWEAIATYVLTGEDASFNGVKPEKNFDVSKGTWGAFEVIGRLSELKVDNSAFTTFADSAVSARKAFEATGGLTWYFNPSVKLNVNYSHTTFDGGAAGGLDREAENVLLTRTQFRF